MFQTKCYIFLNIFLDSKRALIGKFAWLVCIIGIGKSSFAYTQKTTLNWQLKNQSILPFYFSKSYALQMEMHLLGVNQLRSRIFSKSSSKLTVFIASTPTKRLKTTYNLKPSTKKPFYPKTKKRNRQIIKNTQSNNTCTSLLLLGTCCLALQLLLQPFL